MKYRTFLAGFSYSTIKFPIGSRAIMWYENTDFSHTFAIFNTEKHLGSDTVYQSSRGMVNCMSLDNFRKNNEIVALFEVKVREDVYIDIRNSFHATTGVKYGSMQNIGIILSDITGMKNPWKKGYNCSELVYEKALMKLHKDLPYNKDLVTPANVYGILVNKGYERVKGF